MNYHVKIPLLSIILKKFYFFMLFSSIFESASFAVCYDLILNIV